MSQPHPTLTLILDIDSRLDTKEIRLEIQRSYAYVGNTLVRTHEAASEDAPIENTLHLLLKSGRRKYLYSADEGSDELWNGFFEHWFYNAFYKLGNHMKIFNRRQRSIGEAEVVFDWIILELQNGQLRVQMHTDSNSDILPDTSAWLSTIRTALNNGSLGDEVQTVIMPSPTDYKRQYDEGMEAKAERERLAEEQRLAEEEEARKAAEEAEEAAEETFLESPSLVAADKEAEEQARKAQDYSALREQLRNATGATEASAQYLEERKKEEEEGGDGPKLTLTPDEVGPAPQDEIPELAFEQETERKSDATHEAYNSHPDFSFTEADFPIDYRVWDVVYLDGTVRTFDSDSNSFTD